MSFLDKVCFILYWLKGKHQKCLVNILATLPWVKAQPMATKCSAKSVAPLITDSIQKRPKETVELFCQGFDNNF